MGVRQIASVYLIAMSLAVGVFFVISSFFDANDTFDVQSVWIVLDVLMAVGLAIGLVLLYLDKMEERGQHAAGQGDIRRYIAINATFYVTAAIAILFLHNWFNLLANGAEALSGNTTY